MYIETYHSAHRNARSDVSPQNEPYPCPPPVIVAYADDFLFMMFVALAALPLLLLLRNPRRQIARAPAEAAAID